MPKLPGIFDRFHQYLNTISFEDISRWLKFKTDPIQIENFIGNRIIYPQTISQTPQDIQIDLAILTEVLKRDEKLVFNRAKSTVVLDEDFINRFPPKPSIVAITNALSLPERTLVYMKNWSGLHPLGTIINFPVNSKRATISLNGKNYQFARGSLSEIPCVGRQQSLTINDSKVIPVMGGELGIIFNLKGVLQ